MRKLSTLASTLLFLFIANQSVKGQVPDLVNYQAVLRDATGAIMDNRPVTVRLTVHENSGTGPVEFQERHTLTTTAQGLINVQIGAGTALVGTFAGINWYNNEKWLQVEVDAGSGFTDMGAQRLVSVPYAILARNVENDQVDDADADPTNELQTISKTGSVVTLSNGGGSFVDEVLDPDSDPTNELQTISQVGNIVTLSNGGGSVNINDADANPANELNQSLTLTGQTLFLTDAGGTLSVDLSPLGDDADPDPANELNQSFTFDGTSMVSITDAGGTHTVDLSALEDDADADPTNEYNQTVTFTGNTTLNITDGGGTLSVDLSALEDDADPDPTNELITNVSFNGTDLSITDAGGTHTVDLSALEDDADADPTNELNQSLNFNGSILSITDAGGTLNANLFALEDDADPDPTNELQTISAQGPANQPNIALSMGGGNVQLFGAGATTLSRSGNNITISSTDNVNDADADPTNELQSFVLSGTSTPVITLNPLGNAMSFTGSGGITLSRSGNNINIFSTDNVNDADANPANELNTAFFIGGGNLNITDAGGTLSVPMTAIDDGDWSGKGSGQMWPTNLGDRIAIGITTPVNAWLHVAGSGNNQGRFGNTDALFLIADDPHVGFNTYFSGGWFHSSAGYAANTGFDPSSGRWFVQSTAGSGGANTAATMTERLTVINSGNVGIGITTPAARLHVEGGAIRPDDGNSSTAGINWGADLYGGSGDEAFMRYYSEAGENTKLLIGNQNDSDDDIGFYQNGAERMTIWNGSVGVGTTTPGALFHLHAPVNTWQRMTTSTTGSGFFDGGFVIGVQDGGTPGAYIWNGENREMFFGNNGTYRMAIDTFGNVGISGISNAAALLAPAARLEVSTNSTAGAGGATVRLFEEDDDYSRLELTNSNAGGSRWHIAGYSNSTNANERLNFWNSTTGDIVSITGDGLVGVGTTLPTGKLHVPGLLFEDEFLIGDDVFTTNDANYRINIGNAIGTNAFIRIGEASTDYVTYGWVNSLQPGGPYAHMTVISPGFTTPLTLQRDGGRVGIGTTTPAVTLDLVAATTPYMEFHNSTTGAGFFNGTLIGVDGFQSDQFFIWNYENSPIDIGTNNSYRVRIEADGDVGIGTTTPSQRLEVSGGKIALSDFDELLIVNNNVYNHSLGNHTLGDGASAYIMMASQEGQSESAGYFGDENNSTIWNPGDNGRFLRFVDEDAWGDANGNPYDNGAEIAYVDAAGNFITVSDMSKKQNIAPISGAVDKVQQISGYTYELKPLAAEIEKGEQPQRISGVMAQELQKVLPEAVQQNEHGEYFVHYSGIIPLLIEAIKEQQAEMNAQGQDVSQQQQLLEAQQQQIENLQKQIEELKELIKN